MDVNGALSKLRSPTIHPLAQKGRESRKEKESHARGVKERERPSDRQMLGGGEQVMGATALNNKTFAPLAILKYFQQKCKTMLIKLAELISNPNKKCGKSDEC